MSAVGRDPPEMTVAVEILCEGYVQSFVDFFKLVNRKAETRASREPCGTEEETKLEEDAHMQEIQFLKSTLTRTEQAQRNGTTTLILESYKRLAERFEEQDDAETSVYFYSKCLEIACSANDKGGELQANHCLGVAHTSLRKFKLAVEFHEREFEMAKSAGLNEKRTSGNAVIAVYQLRAAELEDEGTSQALASAIAVLEKCLVTAQAVYDRKAQDETSYSLARVHVKMGRPDAAISILTDYIDSCKIQNNEEGEGAGYSVLSAAYIAMKDTDNAVMFLERCLEVSERTGNARVQGEANRNLGVIYNNLGKFERAAENFEKYFEISRMSLANQSSSSAAGPEVDAATAPATAPEPAHDGGAGGEEVKLPAGAKLKTQNTGAEIVKVARTLLGVARGNAHLAGFAMMLENNIEGLLAWKDERRMLANKSLKHQGGADEGSRAA